MSYELMIFQWFIGTYSTNALNQTGNKSKRL